MLFYSAVILLSQNHCIAFGLFFPEVNMLKPFISLVRVLAKLAVVISVAGSITLSQTQGETTALFQKGLTDLKDRKYQEAVEDFKQVCAMRPTMMECHANLGIAYVSLRQDSDAIIE